MSSDMFRSSKTYGRKPSSTHRASQQLGNGSDFLAYYSSRENQLPTVQNQSMNPTSQSSVVPVVGKKNPRSEELTFLPNKKPSQRKEQLRRLIKSGKQEHIVYLQECVKDPKNNQVGLHFRVAYPSEWNSIVNSAEQNCWVDWMVRIGFEAPKPQYPNICSYPNDQIEDLVSALNANLSMREDDFDSVSQTRERAATDPNISAHSSSSSLNGLSGSSNTDHPNEVDLIRCAPSGAMSTQRRLSNLPPSLQRTRSISDPLNIHIERCDSDESTCSPSLSGPNTAESVNSLAFSRPGSSRANSAPSPLDISFISNLNNVSLMSPRTTFPFPGSVLQGRVGQMDRISEVDDIREHSPVATLALQHHLTNNPHHTDDGSDDGTIVDEDEFNQTDAPSSPAFTQTVPHEDGGIHHEEHSTVSIREDDLQSPRPMPSSDSLAALTDCVMHVRPNSNHSHSEHVSFAPFPEKFPRHASPPSRSSFLPFHGDGSAFQRGLHDHLPLHSYGAGVSRQPLKRSITEPVGRPSYCSSLVERGDMTPGACLSQSAAEHYTTPQNKLPISFDPYFVSKAASVESILCLRQLYAICTVRLQSSREADSSSSIASIPKLDGIHRAKSMSSFGGDGHEVRLSYHGRDHMPCDDMNLFSCLGGSGSGEKFHIHNISPPQLRNGRGRGELHRDSSDSSIGIHQYFDHRDSLAHSMSTPPQNNISMAELGSFPSRASSLPLEPSSADHLQKRVKKLKTKAKFRRISGRFSHSHSNAVSSLFEPSDTSMNVSVDGVNLSNSNSTGFGETSMRRKSMAFCMQDDIIDSKPGPMDHIMEEEEVFDETDNDRFSKKKLESRQVETALKSAVVIGGCFHGQYDNYCPVVNAPENAEKCVDDIRFGGMNDLSIRLYIPGDLSSKWIDLGPDWRWMSCSPVGYLVTKSVDVSKPIFYFAPKHPAQWNTFSQLDMDHSDNMDALDGWGEETRSVSYPVPAGNKLGSKLIQHILSYLSDRELPLCLTVNKTWCLIVSKRLITRPSDIMARCGDKAAWGLFKDLVHMYPRGKFLSEGAYKKVYQIRDESGRYDALSVMDVEILRSKGIEKVADVELEISLLCSLLHTMGICPNMIKVYSVFQADYDVSNWDVWNVSSSTELAKEPIDKRCVLKKNFSDKGRHQYCQMEFCSAGDVEEHVRRHKLLNVHDVRSFLFQMLFAMYTARETLSMRHYDIKLLNFFATANTDTQGHLNASRNVLVGFGKHLYNLRCEESSANIVKLADFGTSVIGNETLGHPITLQQFTTLENTPPEFLLLGDSARQSFASDTFCLGLSFLHLLTGFEPYEVLLRDVRCPIYLKAKLMDVWNPVDPHDPYNVIRETILSLEIHDDDEDAEDVNLSRDESIHDVLCDTLYRYLVLVGKSRSFDAGFLHNQLYEHNPVWRVITLSLFDFPSLGPTTSSNSHHGRRPNLATMANNRTRHRDSTERVQCREMYISDLQEYSIHTGANPLMKRVQARIKDLGEGTMDLLDSLLHFDPAQRCTMYDALRHPMFQAMRVSPTELQEPYAHNNTTQYLYYYNRNGADSVDDGLPLL